MQYRPEIDGLRAVALLPVIAFQAGAGQAPCRPQESPLQAPRKHGA